VRYRFAILTLLFVSTFATAEPSLQQQANAAVAKIQGELKIRGLHHPVRVQRDKWGVAHIYADDEHDLFFAQGFVVSQDRLFQMEFWKRSGQGRLAELLGASAVEQDLNARRLRYQGDWKAEYASYAPDTRLILEAFTAGINAYIDWLATPGSPGLPIEFQVAGFKPEHWKPEDCLNRLAAYSMMSNASGELAHAQAITLLGVDKASALFRLDPAVKLEPKPGSDFSGLTPDLLEHIVSSDRRIPFPATSLRESNNWTVSGALTATGKPLLANDPHRVIANPSLRYIVHLVAPGWNVIGAGEPGLPGVAAGHNEQIAWGFTIFGLDQQDLYLETLNPADPHQYQTGNGWTRMKEQQELIHVRGAPDVTATIYFTSHGPVLWQSSSHALSLRWIGAEPGTAGYLGSLSLDRAHDWQEFEKAMPRWKVPSENIVYADREGNIGEHSTGLAPLRKGFNGLLPLPADGRYEWSGFVPNEALPHSFNPAAGFVATANHKMIPNGYPYAVGFEWGAANRYERIRQVLEQAKVQGRKLSVDDMESLQTDVTSLPAQRLQKLLAAAMKSPPDANPDLQGAADLLLHWDGALRVESSAAALYELWAAALRTEVPRLVVPEAARGLFKNLDWEEIVEMLSTPQEALFGVDAPGKRDELLRGALLDARRKLIELQGEDQQHWSWGALHQVTLRHALDGTPALAELFDRGPFARPGDGDTVQATSYMGASFEQIAGASYREIFDLEDWDNARAINVPGQSGQPGSRHYDDLLPLWRQGKYFPLKFSKAAVDEVTTDIMTLEPAAPHRP
jgi:penicillin amidase